MRLLPTLLFVAAAAPAGAAPPPPPPAFVSEAADLLIAAAGRDPAREQALFAPDVAMYENGTLTGRSVADWTRLRGPRHLDGSSRVLAYSEGWDGDGGALLVFDTYDRVERATLPPTFLADPRMTTRSILYQFGADRLIHVVRIARADGFVMTPPAPPPAR